MGIFDITDKYMESKSAQGNSEFKPSKLHEQPLVVEVQNRENNNEKSFIYRETLKYNLIKNIWKLSY